MFIYERNPNNKMRNYLNGFFTATNKYIKTKNNQPKAG